MAVHQIDVLESYIRFLQQTPAEVEALFRDLLIGVTNFFRDPEAFKVLEEQVIPKLFEDKPAGSAVRVWCAGCSTGEEAYSIAILLQERMESLKQNFTVQLFATDIDSRAIATARSGLYPANIAADITPGRLARFFGAESDGSAYRVHKGIRDMLVFSEQDVIKDPPFSRLDLISCRNLLIYLNAELQKKGIPLFHYALRPNGVLLAGCLVTGRCPTDGVPCKTAHARTCRAGAAAPARAQQRAGQRPGRHPLPARAHRHVPGAASRRTRHQQYPENGA